jgi:drug/metabolite transporter (DMT)-like permease
MIAAIRFSIAAVAVLPSTLLTLATAPADDTSADADGDKTAVGGQLDKAANGGSWDMVLGAAAIGVSCFAGYYGQFTALSLGTASNKAAFICSLNAVWVALLTSAITRQIKLQTWVCAALAVAGVAVLEFSGGGGAGGEVGSLLVGGGVESGFVPGTLAAGAAAAGSTVAELGGGAGSWVGDLWSLCQPVGFGTGYVLLERSMARHPDAAGATTTVKVATIAACSIVWAALSGHSLADVAPVR